jgi:hypothetical protein
VAGGTDGPAAIGVAAASTIAPLPPGGLIAALVGNQVNLTWVAPAGSADSYNVKRSTVMGGGGYPPATIIANTPSTNYLDATVTPGNTYFYVVSSVRGGLESTTNSNEVSITIAGGVNAVQDTGGKSRCGWTGLEVLAMLGGLALLRRLGRGRLGPAPSSPKV